jgi:FkbM family methyltransferase
MSNDQSLSVNLCGQTTLVTSGPNDAFWQLVSTGDWEPQTFAVFQRFIDRQHSYIDLGSWVGPTLLYGSRLARAAYGIEADPVAFQELRRNVALNTTNPSNITLSNICIATKSGDVLFGSRTSGGDSTSSLLFGSEKTSWTVAGLTFEDFVTKNDINDCNFVKVDIEGGEFVVVPTMLSYLRVAKPTLFLSLHPCFLYPRLFRASSNYRVDLRLLRILVSMYETRKMMRALKFYRRFYDDRGRVLTFGRLLRVCRGTLAIVATDLSWKG